MYIHTKTNVYTNVYTFKIRGLEFGVLIAPFHPLFAAARTILGTLAAMKTNRRIARTGVLLVFQRHFADFALVKFLLRINKHMFLLIFNLKFLIFNGFIRQNFWLEL